MYDGQQDICKTAWSLPVTSAPVSQPLARSVSTRPGCTATAMSWRMLSLALKRRCHSCAASRVASFEFAYPLNPADSTAHKCLWAPNSLLLCYSMQIRITSRLNHEQTVHKAGSRVLQLYSHNMIAVMNQPSNWAYNIQQPLSTEADSPGLRYSLYLCTAVQAAGC